MIKIHCDMCNICIDDSNRKEDIFTDTRVKMMLMMIDTYMYR